MTFDAQIEAALNKYTPEVASLGRAAVAYLREKYPRATVLVYDNYNALVFGFGRSEKASEAAFSVALYPRWINLFFLYGAALPDPERRLKGAGKQVRSIVLETVAVLKEPAVNGLLELAALQVGIPEGTKPAGKIVIRAVAAKQRPRTPSPSKVFRKRT